MPNLRLKLEKLLSEAAECQLFGNLATNADARSHYRERADQFRILAEQVRTQISERLRSDTEFLFEQAAHCRGFAATITDAALKGDLIRLAVELEQTARRERGET